MKNAVVLFVDGLGAGFLGPYGNTSLPTPAFNRLASESIVAEHVLIDSPHLGSQYRSMHYGVHTLGHDRADGTPSLPQLLSDTDTKTTWISDSANPSLSPAHEDFTRAIAIELPKTSRIAAEVEETWLADFFSQATEALQRTEYNNLFWIQCPGLFHTWDAPLELRFWLSDDEDPDIPEILEPPAFQLPKDFDPDVVHGIECVCGGQIMLLDMMLDVLLSAIEQALPNCLVVIGGNRGFPIGQHGMIGIADRQLQAELTQVPLMVRFPNEAMRQHRSQTLFQPHDIYQMLASWFEADKSSHPSDHLPNPWQSELTGGSQIAVCFDEQELAIRTACWYARVCLPNHVQLYLKPDDRWNANDVAELCPDAVADVLQIVEQLSSDSNPVQLDSIQLTENLTSPPM